MKSVRSGAQCPPPVGFVGIIWLPDLLLSEYFEGTGPKTLFLLQPLISMPPSSSVAVIQVHSYRNRRGPKQTPVSGSWTGKAIG